MSGGNDPWDRCGRRFRQRSPTRAGDSSRAQAADDSSLRLSSGRMLAWRAMQLQECTDRFLQDIFATLDAQHSLVPRDRAAAVDIACGIVRRRRTLDAILQKCTSRPQQQVEPDLWRVLQIGAFQLVISGTPPHAAVDSAVRLCRSLNCERWTGFVNGVLRNVGRLLTDDISTTPSSQAVPLTSGTWRLLKGPLFADPVSHLVEYVAEAFSLPSLLAERWAARLTQEALFETCFASCSPPRTTLRVNLLRTCTTDVAAMLRADGCEAVPGNLEGSLVVSAAARIDRLSGYSEGLWSVQDESAMAAGLLTDPKPGERILDLCAAPGGKTTHLAELSGDAAEITACDISASRLQRLAENAARLRLDSIQPRLITRDGGDIPEGPFDAVLVDAPCSNTGVLSRRPEARWRFRDADLRDLAALQQRLLLTACQRLAPGGRIVYSTCSLEPEENREVADAVLSLQPGLRLAHEHQYFPGRSGDGAYQALLKAVP